MRYSDKSLCRADLHGGRQDIFSFWIEFRRWRVDFLCGTFDRVYLHLGVAEKAQDINLFRVERRQGKQDNCLFRGEFRRLTRIALRGTIHNSIFLVRSNIRRSIVWNEVAKGAVS